MYFEGAYRFIGTINPEPLVRAVQSLGDDAWFEHVERQQKFHPHRRTQTIPLLYDDDGRHTNPTQWSRWAELRPVIDPVMKKIREANASASGRVDEGYFIRAILARLLPHGWISGHRDEGNTLAKSHRNHIPVITNRGVEFEVAEEVRHLAAGEIWEINNREEHAVRNTSDFERIHLIIDYVVPGEKIEDPDGTIIA